MSLARTALQQLRIVRPSLHNQATARQAARTSPLVTTTAGRTAVTRRALSTASQSSSTTAYSSALSATRWTAVAAVGASLALGLGVMQTRSVYMEEAPSGRASSGKKNARKESKKEDAVESKEEGDKAPKESTSEGGKKAAKLSTESAKGEEGGKDVAQEDAQVGKEAEEQETSSLDMDNLSEEASQQSAFDPETNTINWDCPCLGGMAHGPCGEQFKDAFSCFVFSEADPKGVDCIENFKAMQDCFRKYPEHYKEELEDEEEANTSGEEASKQAGGSEGESKHVGNDDEEEEDEGLREWRVEMAKEA